MADALSRREAVEDGVVKGANVGTLCIISFHTPIWLDDFKMTYNFDSAIQKMILAIQLGSDIPAGFTFCNGLLFYKGRLFLGSSSQDLKA